MAIRYEEMATQDVYDVFFNAIKNKEGTVKVIRIDGEKKPVFILKKNPFNKTLVLSLDSLSIHKVSTLFGKVISVDKVMSINQIPITNTPEHFKTQMEKVSKKISENLKKRAMQRMKKVTPKPKVKPKIKIKPKIRKPMVR